MSSIRYKMHLIVPDAYNQIDHVETYHPGGEDLFHKNSIVIHKDGVKNIEGLIINGIVIQYGVFTPAQLAPYL